jgi:hypothetical protein
MIRTADVAETRSALTARSSSSKRLRIAIDDNAAMHKPPSNVTTKPAQLSPLVVLMTYTNVPAATTAYPRTIRTRRKGRIQRMSTTTRTRTRGNKAT